MERLCPLEEWPSPWLRSTPEAFAGEGLITHTLRCDPVYPVALSSQSGARRLRKKSASGKKEVPQGLKPEVFSAQFTARLKSCPDTKPEFFRNLQGPALPSVWSWIPQRRRHPERVFRPPRRGPGCLRSGSQPNHPRSHRGRQTARRKEPRLAQCLLTRSPLR